MIPLFANRPTIKRLLPEIARRQRAVLESGRYILGPEVEAFEREFASFVGRRHCIGVANGTDALTIGLRALGIGEGDEVIVPAFTFFATPEAVVNAGARPVFCDIDPETDCMTAETAAAAVTTRTRALMPVHIFGNPAPMDELTELATSRGIFLVGDAAQAAGARIGERSAAAYGDVATFSFYPSKNLGAFGDGGAIVTDSDEVAASARRIRTHGTLAKGYHEELGYNSRLDELQATALRVLLPHLDEWTHKRREVAAMYRSLGLEDSVKLPIETRGGASAFHLYVIRTAARDNLEGALRARNVETRPYYTTPMHKQPALASYSDGVQLPHAEHLAACGLALPMGPALEEKDVEQVVSGIRATTSAQSPA